MDDRINGFRSIYCIFNITEEKIRFELYNFPDEESGGISYIKVRDEIEKDLHISEITASDLEEGYNRFNYH